VHQIKLFRGQFCTIQDAVFDEESEVVIKGHTKPVTSIDVCREGSFLVSGSLDGTTRLWNLGKEGRVQYHYCIGPHLSKDRKRLVQVKSVALSADGMRVASGGTDGTVYIHDRMKPNSYPMLVYKLEGHEHWVNSVTFSSSDDCIASAGSKGMVRVWKLAKVSRSKRNFEETYTRYETHFDRFNCHTFMRAVADTLYHLRLSNDLELSADMRFGEGGGVMVYETTPKDNPGKNGKPEYRCWHWNSVNVATVTISPNNKQIAVGMEKRIFDEPSQWLCIYLFDIGEVPAVAPLQGHSDSVTVVEYSSDGKLLASGSYDNSVRVWSVEKKEQMRIFRGHWQCICCLCFSWCGTYLISGSEDTKVAVWSMETGKMNGYISTAAVVTSVTCSRGNERIVIGTGDGRVHIYSFLTQHTSYLLLGSLPATHKTPVTTVAYFPSGDILVTGNRGSIFETKTQEVMVWDVSDVENPKLQLKMNDMLNPKMSLHDCGLPQWISKLKMLHRSSEDEFCGLSEDVYKQCVRKRQRTNSSVVE